MNEPRSESKREKGSENVEWNERDLVQFIVNLWCFFSLHSTSRIIHSSQLKYCKIDEALSRWQFKYVCTRCRPNSLTQSLCIERERARTRTNTLPALISRSCARFRLKNETHVSPKWEVNMKNTCAIQITLEIHWRKKTKQKIIRCRLFVVFFFTLYSMLLSHFCHAYIYFEMRI